MPKMTKKIVAIVALAVGVSVIVPATTANAAVKAPTSTVTKAPIKDFIW
jgi:hypothetical protein